MSDHAMGLTNRLHTMSVIGGIDDSAAGFRFQTGSAANGMRDHANGSANRLHYRSSIVAGVENDARHLKMQTAKCKLAEADEDFGAEGGELRSPSQTAKCKGQNAKWRRRLRREGSGRGFQDSSGGPCGHRMVQNSESRNQNSELRAGTSQPRMNTDEHG
jgi:hypothetical protein